MIKAHPPKIFLPGLATNRDNINFQKCLRGPPGEPGSKGEKGDKGLKGDNGVTGAHGAPGVKGQKGEKGTQGIQSSQSPRVVVYPPILTVKENQTARFHCVASGRYKLNDVLNKSGGKSYDKL